MKFTTVFATALAVTATAVTGSAISMSNKAPNLIKEMSNNEIQQEMNFVKNAAEFSCANDEKCDMCKMIADTIEDKAPELTKDAVKEVESFCKTVESQALIHTACEAAKTQLKPMVEKFLEHIDGQCDKLPFCQPHNFLHTNTDYKQFCNNDVNQMTCKECLDMTKQLEDTCHKGLETINSTLSALCSLLGSGKDDCQSKMTNAVKSVASQIDNYLNPVCKSQLHLCD